MRFWKQIAVVLGMFVLLVLPQPAQGTDIPIFPTGPVFQLNGLVWGTSTQPGFNNNYFFTPISVSENVCVFVYNNNTTSAHTFTSTIAATGNPRSITPSDNTWNLSANFPSLVAGSAPSQAAGFGASVSGSSQVAIELSLSSTQAGSPDTANIVIVQSVSSCLPGNNFSGSAQQAVNASPPILAISDNLGQAFDANSGVVTNPVILQDIVNVNVATGSHAIYFDKVIISCSAACVVNLSSTTTAGSTCSNTGLQSIRTGAGGSSAATATQTCTVHPNTASVTPVNIGANVPFIFDLSGFISVPGTTSGFEVQMQTALTGTISASLFWHEK